jgi:hypothetical protein
MTPSGPLFRLARRSMAAALHFSGAVRMLRRLRAGPPGVLILRYHSIDGGPGLRDSLVVSERHFASHVRYLRRAYRSSRWETSYRSLNSASRWHGRRWR